MTLVSRVAGENGRTWCMHSLYSFFLPPLAGGRKKTHFKNFLEKGGRGWEGGSLKNIFGGGRAWWERVDQFLEDIGSGFLEIAIVNFTS